MQNLWLPVAKKLPEFWMLASEIASDLYAGNYADWPPLIARLQPLLNADLVAEMDGVIPGWRKIATLHNGQTARHTLLVLAACMNLPEYEQADAPTRLEIEWAAVLHDLDKDRAQNDTAHPFRSAAVVAGIMPRLGFELQPHCDNTHLAAWSALVMSAQREDGGRMIHDHTQLAEIVAGMRHCWGEGTPAIRILKAVLFHQSLPTLQAWPNAVLLTDDELCLSLTLDDMAVLSPLLIADSDSWNLFDEPRMAYLAELRASNTETCRRLRAGL